MNFPQTMMAERQIELERIVPFRERGLYMLGFMKKHRINENTVILIKAHLDKTEQINRFLSKLEKDRKNY